ncbi:MAG: hypothetical protein IKD66_05745 [Solobacterium sp.]|nr:hypothetical protein [Solobacterium sp.]
MEGKKDLIEEQEEQVTGAGPAKPSMHCSKCGSEEIRAKLRTTPDGKVIIGYHCRACGSDCSHRQASGVLTEYGLSFKRTSEPSSLQTQTQTLA